ncbi:hypothetical protein J1770_gp56 [Gordonia phage EMoore]|uniref:Uncharacterized protein n=1 Tax=Gordonia phage EMoore TaxID=2656534 RepID=A0A649VV77_9CAUD|nr:hypothetical protein J1770_gp56 [Gordonia phage EMoore]QGJ95842.1 hypothetical protein SEA_EMOORE_56 [Gordonia phage EMoore]
MTTPKPSTPPAGPSGVSHTKPINLTDEVARMTAIVTDTLRTVLDLVGVPYTEPIIEAKRQSTSAPNHLDAMRTAWDEGYGECVHDDAGAAINPYAKLLDDRRQFVREHVENGYGALIDEDGDNVLGDDNAEWFDAVLDAHDEWLTLQRHIEPQPADSWRDDVVNARIRADQAEARVAELDRTLRDVLDALNRDTGYNAVKINGARIALAHAGYGTHPDSGGWIPPYSAEQALGKIWHVLTEGTLDRDDQRLNGVRDVLADMGYHEHVHTRLADALPPECGETHGHEQTFDGRAYTCRLSAGHDGLHLDHTAGVTWS